MRVLKKVDVSKIAEFPVDVGRKCSVLSHYKVSPYFDPEEKIYECLASTAQGPETTSLCLQGYCSTFHKGFLKGITPFAEKDPIRLLEYRGRYWVEEGKHRVCLAMRTGVAEIDAIVTPIETDYHLLLEPAGGTGTYRSGFVYAFTRDYRIVSLDGEILFLWVYGVSEIDRISSQYIWLDAERDTGGEERQVLPGVRYSVWVRRRKRRRCLVFPETAVEVEAQVTVDRQHQKTKIWLMRLPVEKIWGPGRLQNPLRHQDFATLYRYGRWGRWHEQQLAHLSPVFYP